MTENLLRELTKEYNNIKKLEYIKSISRGNTSVNTTFDKLIRKNKKLSEYLDKESITIKVKRSYSKAFITLFDMIPNNNDILNIFLEDTKKKNVIINSNKVLKINKYYLKLKVDYKEECVRLIITDYFNNIIENNIYWPFSELKDRVLNKLSILALVKAWPDRVGEYEYFKYYKMNIYLFKSFNFFLAALNNGNICLNLKINYHKEKGISYRVSFIIKEEDLLAVYDLYR